MKPHVLVLTSIVAALAACAPAGGELLVPEDIELDWDARFESDDDGVGVLIPVDVMVYQADTGVPMSGVELHLQPASGSAHVLATDEVHRIAPEFDDEPDAYWDVWDSHRVDFDPPLHQLDSDLSLQTDSDGLARAMVWIDAFGPAADGPFAPVQIVVTAAATDGSGEMTETFALIPR